MIQYKKKKKDGLIIPSNLGNEGIDYQNGYEDGKASVQPNIVYKEITDNNTWIDATYEGCDGFNPVFVNIDTDSYYNNGYAKGKEDEAAETKKNSQSFTAIENGVFEPLTYFNKVTVNVDTTTPYNNGYKAGEEAKAKEIASKAESLNVTENGTYTPSTYYKDVTVRVEGGGTVEPVYLIMEYSDGYGSGSDATITSQETDRENMTGLYYSLDEMATWNVFDETTSFTLSTGGKAYFKRNGIFSQAGFRFSITGGTVNLSGNISAILGSENSWARKYVPYKAYAYLFNACAIYDASALELSAPIVGAYGYSNLFRASTLSVPPTLPAMEVQDNGYQTMFRETRVSDAPALPATKVGAYAYQYMFYGDNYLIVSPVLILEDVPDYCYLYMFNNCKNLKRVTSYAKTFGTSALSNWLKNVGSNGNFYNLGGATYESGISGIPTGWTEHTEL